MIEENEAARILQLLELLAWKVHYLKGNSMSIMVPYVEAILVDATQFD